MHQRIITHNDFDGIVSAAICAHALKIDRFIFTGPSTIAESRISITTNDVVCDLPYPLECGKWFDHHEGNLAELRYRNIDAEDIEGRFAVKDSCARVVYDHFMEAGGLPDYFEPTVDEADIIDSFNYDNIEAWRKETPGHVINDTMKLRDLPPRERDQYYAELTRLLRDHPLAEVAQSDLVKERHATYRAEEERMLEMIERDASFLPQDTKREIVILDFTHHKRRPYVVKNLAYLMHPEALAVIEVQSMFRRGIKTNNLTLSMSLSITLNAREHAKDVGEIMRSLNIGEGHAGAAAGSAYCDSKDEMLRTKRTLLDDVFEMWSRQ